MSRGYEEATSTNKAIDELIGRLLGIDMQTLHLSEFDAHTMLPALNYLRTVESHCDTVRQLVLRRGKKA